MGFSIDFCEKEKSVYVSYTPMIYKFMPMARNAWRGGNSAAIRKYSSKAIQSGQKSVAAVSEKDDALRKWRSRWGCVWCRSDVVTDTLATLRGTERVVFLNTCELVAAALVVCRRRPARVRGCHACTAATPASFRCNWLGIVHAAVALRCAAAVSAVRHAQAHS